MVEVHNSSVEEDEEGRHIFTPRARRIMKSRFGGFSALVAGIVILIQWRSIESSSLVVGMLDGRCSPDGCLFRI